MFINEIINGNSLLILKQIPNKSVHCCITSPPYWKLRDYQHDDQIGNESTPLKYINHLIEIFDQVKRILKNTGTCWVVISEGLENKTHLMIPERFATRMIERGWLLRNKIIWKKDNGMPQSAKDRYSINWEYVYLFTKSEKYYFKTQYQPYADSSIIQMFEKYKGQATKDFDGNNVQNASNTKRNIIKSQGKTAEYYLTKYNDTRIDRMVNERKQSRIIATEIFKDKKERQKFINWVHDHSTGIKFGGNKKAGGDNATYSGKEWIPSPLGSIQRAIWDINTENCGFEHFAVFPKELVRRCIDAGCPEEICDTCKRMKGCHCENRTTHKAVVLDPFMGKGTTALVALNMNRNFIGIELNKSYIDIANFIIKPLLQ